MSSLRPTLVNTIKPGLNYYGTYFRVLQAVRCRRSLIHGRLNDDRGGVCAIGAYFQETNVPVSSMAIEEIAAYNDSFPRLSPHMRWKRVKEWLTAQTAHIMKVKP